MEMNLVVVRGPLSGAPEVRSLAVGDVGRHVGGANEGRGAVDLGAGDGLGSARLAGRTRGGRRRHRPRRGPAPVLPLRRGDRQPRRCRVGLHRPGRQTPSGRGGPQDRGVARGAGRVAGEPGRWHRPTDDRNRQLVPVQWVPRAEQPQPRVCRSTETWIGSPDRTAAWIRPKRQCFDGSRPLPGTKRGSRDRYDIGGPPAGERWSGW